MVFKTENGGASWQLASRLKENTFVFDSFFIDDQFGWFLTSGELWETGNGGQSWTPTLTLNYARHGVVRDIFFIDKDHGWLVTGEGYILNCSH
ncbi:hypothetical protein JXA02_06305 [candidate division KSB1 bacterium]|nr:hypothetical protein [candidate division KSB1 bacterium]RQW07459.1 MAG: hypothetical protein EH222_07315 [candidate division KSB1 bacterium]